ncbi:hypothetical protein SCLARK_00766 [Spiroplasma clarkii]|uniref:Uncharacterized protein n=1 Tax=Spiroplasma clarkii TaxID=2139 RepID=A0A1Y0L097_9MOLU|nr:hypothetical protein [Spiroplasma clarkii]ARU91403.1 hypothetical protein SCLARK_00766 [Spiroplasma clarkii]ATX70819.1 hypothetical protein SCLAR_v1c05000 [Spiroplasma clarkii]
MSEYELKELLKKLATSSLLVALVTNNIDSKFLNLKFKTLGEFLANFKEPLREKITRTFINTYFMFVNRLADCQDFSNFVDLIERWELEACLQFLDNFQNKVVH